MAYCLLLHSWLAAQLRSCDATWTSGGIETLGYQYRLFVRPAVMSKTCQPLCVLRAFEKNKCIFACCFIPCSCFSWNAIFNFGPSVCTLSLPLMTRGLLSDKGQISTMMKFELEKINCWAWFSMLLFSYAVFSTVVLLSKYCLFKQRHKPLSIYLCIFLITYFPLCLIKKFTNQCVEGGFFSYSQLLAFICTAASKNTDLEK